MGTYQGGADSSQLLAHRVVALALFAEKLFICGRQLRLFDCADMIEDVLAKNINGLEPRLTQQGCNAKVLAELLNAKPREIKSFLSGQLAPGRTLELQSELLAAGIPL